MPAVVRRRRRVVGRQEIEDGVKIRLQELCDQYETGIVVDQIVLQDVNPPDQVKASFNEVNQAEQERERAINEALSLLEAAGRLLKGTIDTGFDK